MSRYGFMVIILATCGIYPAATRADFTLNFPEANGPFGLSGFSPRTVATLALTPPAGETITSATLTGTFGSTSTFVNGGTAGFNLLVNNTSIGGTSSLVSGVPFSINVNPSLLTGGSVTLSYLQTSAGIVRLSATSLNVITSAAVPEPASITMVGLGLAGVGIMARRRRLVA